MIVKREVLLKAIVTDKLRTQLKDAVQGAIGQLTESQEEMEKQYRRLMLEVQRMDASRAMAVRQQVDIERRKHEDAKKDLEEQLAEYDELKDGEEFVLRTLEGTVEIQVGDNFFEKVRGAEIVIQDDIVKEIREQSPEPA
jgi:hypothetical protein